MDTVMTTFLLERNFGHLLSDEDSDKKRYLSIRGKKKDGNLVKKKMKENEKFVIENLKIVQEAWFGTNESNSIDVTEKVNLILEKIYISQNFTQINSVFFDFLKQFTKIICPRCYNEKTSSKVNPHNNGYLNMCIMEAPVNTYQQLFEGFFKCFIAYVINNDSNFNKSKKDRFIEYFSDLLINSNKNNNELFEQVSIIYNELVGITSNNENYIKIVKKMKTNTYYTINGGYNYIYPVLKYFYENKNAIFIRHGLEKKTKDYKRDQIFPPNDDNHGWRINKVTNNSGNAVPTILPAYPIEVDKFPLTNCASHSTREMYGLVKGFISFPIFKQNKGIIHARYENGNNVMPRDHLFAESNIHIKNWVFTYKKGMDADKQRDVKAAVKVLIQEEIPIMDEKLLPLFSLVIDAIVNKFILLH